MIRNIVFDMGNVVLRFEPESFMTREGITDPADREILRRELYLSTEWAQMDYGHETEDTFEPKVKARVPEHLRSHIGNLLRFWRVMAEQVPGMEDLVRRVKEAGYGVYLLSNASAGQPTYWHTIPVSRYFDGTLISSDVKTIKPCPDIYRIFTEKFALKPEECLFVDDATANVAGAVNSGWQGIVFHGDAAELERKMREMGIEI